MARVELPEFVVDSAERMGVNPRHGEGEEVAAEWFARSVGSGRRWSNGELELRVRAAMAGRRVARCDSR